MTYKEMITEARVSGSTSEEKMWNGIEQVGDLLEAIKDEHPELYWAFMRKQYAALFGGHYDELFARYDVDQLRYKGKDGNTHHGEYWSMPEIQSATMNMTFPSGTTDWDKYVAFNAFAADTNAVLGDSDILRAGKAFFFDDEDWKGNKVWDYFSNRC